MRVKAQDVIKTYYDMPSAIRAHCVWKMRKATFEQIDRDVYPVKINNQLMGLPVVIDHQMSVGNVKLEEQQ